MWQEHISAVDSLQSVAVLVVKDSWSSAAVLEQSSHLMLHGIQTDTDGVVECVGMSWCPPPHHWWKVHHICSCQDQYEVECPPPSRWRHCNAREPSVSKHTLEPCRYFWMDWDQLSEFRVFKILQFDWSIVGLGHYFDSARMLQRQYTYCAIQLIIIRLP